MAAQPANRVFELRIATLANKEKLNVLMDRFRGGELKIWDRLGMKSVGYSVRDRIPEIRDHTDLHPGAREPEKGR